MLYLVLVAWDQQHSCGNANDHMVALGAASVRRLAQDASILKLEPPPAKADFIKHDGFLCLGCPRCNNEIAAVTSPVSYMWTFLCKSL